MARHWEDREYLKANIGSGGMAAHACLFLGVLFAVVGVIGDAANMTLGLEPASWFLLAIVAILASITFFIGWAVAWYLKTTETKKRE